MTLAQHTSLGSVGNVLNLVNSGMDIATKGVGVYSEIKYGGNRYQQNYGGTATETVVVNQKSPEEIEIERQRLAEEVKNNQFQRAIMLNSLAQNTKIPTAAAKDNTVLYIVGSLGLVTVIVLFATKQNKPKQNNSNGK